MGRVIVLGSLMTDLVARAERFPHAGESLIGEEFSIFVGGKGLNQAVTAARLGASVSLIGHVGSDAFGDAFFPALAAEGVDHTYVSRDATVGTGVGCVTINIASGQNTIVAFPRANLALTPEAVEAAMRGIVAGSPSNRSAGNEAGRTGVFLTQCETRVATTIAGLRYARNAGMTTILNAAPIPQEPLADDLFTFSDILIVNEVEASMLAEISVDSAATAELAAVQLLRRGPRHVIITLGAHGFTWSTRGDSEDAPPAHHWTRAFPVQQVDATAAGDAFCGALAARLAAGKPLAEALQWANAAGALTVTRAGALPSLPRTGEIEALL
ncbi:MAG: ribokinase [Chloroflexota bacterium]|nr:ribokinase [Chloroflexota bacterium]